MSEIRNTIKVLFCVMKGPVRRGKALGVKRDATKPKCSRVGCGDGAPDRLRPRTQLEVAHGLLSS